MGGFGKCCPGLFDRCRPPPPSGNRGGDRDRGGDDAGGDGDGDSSSSLSSPERDRRQPQDAQCPHPHPPPAGGKNGKNGHGGQRRHRHHREQHQRSPPRSFQHNMLREHPHTADVLEYYEILDIIGEGSISTITKARKRNVGGSARLSHEERRRRRRRKEGKLPLLLPDWGRSGLFLRGCFGAKASGASGRKQRSGAADGKNHGESSSSSSGSGASSSGASGQGRRGETATATVPVKARRRQRGPHDDTAHSSELPSPEGGGGNSNAPSPSSTLVVSSSALASNYGSAYSGVTSSSTAPPSSSSLPTTRSHERYYALKTINLRLIKEEYLQELRNEVHIFKHLDHPNIAKAYETYCHKKHLCVVMELCTGGDLHVRAPYTEREACTIVGKLLSAVAYMHQNNVMHRDLKYENILFENRRPDADIKLIDFGLAKKYLSPTHVMTERVGTVYTMAPEVVRGTYTFKADLWSVGVIAYMLLSNTKPFWGKKKKRIVEKIIRGRYHFLGQEWSLVSREARFFVRALIQVDPTKRLTAEEAQVHPWLTHSYKLSERRPSEEFIDRVNENIVRFADSGEFKKVALNVIAHKSTAEDIVQLRKVFDQYDRNNDGAISYGGFKEALAKFRYSEEELDAMFRCVDINDNGVIFYTEFLAAALEAQGRIEEERLAEAFDRIDSDNTGYISKENLCQILGTKCTDEYAAKLLAEADVDNDGQVSYEEFLNLFLGQKNREIHEIYEADTRSEPSSSSSNNNKDDDESPESSLYQDALADDDRRRSSQVPEEEDDGHSSEARPGSN